MKEKKPDNVVYDQETNRYVPSLKPYATNLSAPVIETVDTVTWKNTNIQKVNKQFKAVYDELKDQYQALMNRFQYNELVYGARFNFEPLVGETYHLYIDDSQQYFLSIINPNECNFNFIGSFRLDSDKVWEKIG